MSNTILSLCMPTNGVVEWVFPVLDSIFEQGCCSSDFEVVITDNGNNTEFKKKIKEYVQGHKNIRYYETEALPFINEIESYKKASGQLLKFVNHRTRLVKGALQRLIDFAKYNADKRPIIYFSNGVLKKENKAYLYETFDDFVRNLSYWSSWSTGMTIWKEDFEHLPEDVQSFNELFPHTNVLFAEQAREKYIIDNSIIFDEMPQGRKPKGTYDLYYAFGVEYPGIILDLLRSGSITTDTFKAVIDGNLEFIACLYFNYNIRKNYCSYDLSGYNDMTGVFYSKEKIRTKVFEHIINIIRYKLKRSIPIVPKKCALKDSIVNRK